MRTRTSIFLIGIMLLLCICSMVLESFGRISGVYRIFFLFGSMGFAIFSYFRWNNKYSAYWEVRGCPEKKSYAYFGKDENWKTGNNEIDDLHNGYILWITATIMLMVLFMVYGNVKIALAREKFYGR